MMKFNLQNHSINLSSNETLHPQVNVVFSFGHNYLENAQKISERPAPNNIDNLTDVGSYSLGLSSNNNTYLTLNLGSPDKPDSLDLNAYHKALNSLAQIFKKNPNIINVNIILEQQIASFLNQDFTYYVEQTIFHILNNMYVLDTFKSKKSQFGLKQLNVTVPKDIKVDIKKSIATAIILLDSTFLIRNLANGPANSVTPTFLAETASKATTISQKVKVTILEENDIRALNMNAFLAVAKGSIEKPKFIVMEYNGGDNNQKPIVLIGKGITFDSGGISIKPSLNMEAMKYDMCGAATVIGTFFAAVNLNLPINLVVLIPTCENLPSGTALKPGDIVTTMSGQTVEVLNTDAEGRLILCDALTYALKHNPELVIDIATLTGACVIALGHIATGMYSNDNPLAKQLLQSSKNTNDKIWQMPLFDEYHDLLKSDIADIANISPPGSGAGSPIAAIYLSKFVDYKYKWAHLDIAGTAWNGGGLSSTGRPFYLLIDFLRNYQA